jgi:hypothetical protein
VPRAVNGKISYISGNPTAKDDTCGKMRKMFVTVTNVPPTVSNSTRLLQSVESFSLTFTSTDGPAATTSFAFTLMSSLALVFASLIYLAF